MSNKTQKTYQRVTNTDTPVNGSAVSTHMTWTDSFVRTGSDNPKFRQAIKLGQSATGSLNVEIFEAKYPTSSLAAMRTDVLPKGLERHTGTCGINAQSASFSSVPASLQAEADNAAAICLRQKISQQTKSFSGLTMLGELRKTIKLIRDPFREMRRYTEFLIKQRRRAGNSRETISKTWLEFQFGVVPLINDISNIASAALDRIDTAGEVQRLVCTQTRTSSVSDNYLGGVLGMSTKYNRSRIRKVTVKYVCGYKTLIDAQRGALESIAAKSGFDLQDVATTAWELLPWSFLVDYFTNIGNVLEANTTSLSQVAWAYKTTIVEEQVKLSNGVATISPAQGYITSNTCPTAEITSKRIVRMGADIPYGSVSLSLPAKPNQFLNMLALLTAQSEPTRRSK